jgi:hypothetical protein
MSTKWGHNQKIDDNEKEGSYVIHEATQEAIVTLQKSDHKSTTLRRKN